MAYITSRICKRIGITFNQFLIDDEQPTVIHTGPIGIYKQVEEKVKQVIRVSIVGIESTECENAAMLTRSVFCMKVEFCCIVDLSF